MTKKTLLITLLLFLLSVIIRIPNLNRPLSKHHEFNTAFFLIPMEVWYQTTGCNYNFSPVLNYQNKGDKGINNFLGEATEKDGYFFYFSFGAGAYVIPYFFLSFFGGPSVLGLQIFSLFVHLFCTLLIIKIAHWFLDKNNLKTSFALVSGIVYLFIPITLWFHGNGYTHHSMVVLFFLSSVFYALKVFEKEGGRKELLLLLISLFLTIYTEWVGCFLAFIIFSVAIYKRNKLIVFISVLSVVLALGCITWQYSSLVGINNFLNYLKDRYSVRTNLKAGEISYLAFLLKYMYWYVLGFGFALLLIIVNFILFLKNKIKIDRKLYLLILFIPALLHHIIFSEFTFVHDYSVLIDASFLSVFTSIILARNHRKTKQTSFSIIGITFISFSILQYYIINRPGKISQRGESYSVFQTIGTYIHKHVKKDEFVFIQNLPDLPNPQVVFYSKRNFYSINSESEMREIVFGKQIKKVFFVKVKDYRITNSIHLEF
jgi:hypothetical protein